MKPTTMIKFALDTNVIIYSHSIEDAGKQTIAKRLLAARPVISGQVLSEYLNVMKRSFSMNKADVMDLCIQTLDRCLIHPVSLSILKTAQQLIHRYDFQIFDSIIVASALDAGCEALYSEDMQHNLKVEDRLSIINPFL